MKCSNHSSQGFTLVELLVVIAIIAILASILLPSLNQAKKKVKTTECQNKQRQTFVALSLYAGDAGEYPTNYQYNDAPSWNWGDECSGRWNGGPPSRSSCGREKRHSNTDVSAASVCVLIFGSSSTGERAL